MDRKTRKANFQKLQSPAPTNSRMTRNSKKSSASGTISKYYDTPHKRGTEENERPNPMPLAEPESKGKGRATKLKTFLFKSEDTAAKLPTKKQRESDLFEPTQTKVKKAPKLKNLTTKAARKLSAKGQPSIKSAFLRNEQMFAEITAQHCLADNFSPDDIELALAISQSEVDSQTKEATTEEVADINRQDSVRAKLQKYGFRTAAKEEYNARAFNCLPGSTRGRRGKWANKFTALTLRHPERQAKKLQANVNALMALQCKVRSHIDDGNAALSYSILTAKLTRLAAAEDCKIITKAEERCTQDLNEFYVNELFETCTLPAGHLLKNWKAIQGRDLSPEPANSQCRERVKNLRKVYAELEMHFVSKQLVKSTDVKKDMACAAKQTEKLSTEAAACSDELDKFIQLIKADVVHTPPSDKPDSQYSINSIAAVAFIEEPPDKRIRLHTTEDESLMGTAQTTRITSPDIFADSDEDSGDRLTESTENSMLLDLPSRVHKHVVLEVVDKDITSFEIYSSNEVKTSSCADAVEQVTAALPISLNKSLDLAVGLDDECETNSTIHITPLVHESTIARKSVEYDCIFELSSETDSEKAGLHIEFANSSQLISQLSANSAMPQSPNEISSLNFRQTKQKHSRLHFTSTLNVKGEDYDMPRPNYVVSPSNRDSFAFAEAHLLSPLSSHSFKLPKDETEKIFNKSSSFNRSFVRNESTQSVDLTGEESDDDNCLMLSDDEINYSIRRADKTHDIKDTMSQNNAWQYEEQDNCSIILCDALSASPAARASTGFRLQHELGLITDKSKSDEEQAKAQPISTFAKDDEMDAFLMSTQGSMNTSGGSRSPNKSALSRERAEFGIMDAALSESFTQSQLASQPVAEQTEINWSEASFLDRSNAFTTAPMKRYSSSNKPSNKFNKLLRTSGVVSDDLGDEFDRLVSGAMESVEKLKQHEIPMPSGFEQLLTGELSFQMPEAAKVQTPAVTPATSPMPTKTPKATPTPVLMTTLGDLDLSEQIEVNGNIYIVSVSTSPKPDYSQMPYEELLKHLYNFGLKPLKRKQAVKMLEFIYNQTHPIVLDSDEDLAATNNEKTVSRTKSKSTSVLPSDSAIKERTGDKHFPQTQIDFRSIVPNIGTMPSVEPSAAPLFELQDAYGDQLLRYSQQLQAALTSDDEWFVLQTNINKKTPQPLLPLHIAWHNLLCANPLLHECVLMYEPIDLQQIYLYLKSLGYRYDPKDLKIFFDHRCIIFRYDLNAAAGQSATSRNVRKTSRQKSSAKGN